MDSSIRFLQFENLLQLNERLKYENKHKYNDFLRKNIHMICLSLDNKDFQERGFGGQYDPQYPYDCLIRYIILETQKRSKNYILKFRDYFKYHQKIRQFKEKIVIYTEQEKKNKYEVELCDQIERLKLEIEETQDEFIQYVEEYPQIEITNEIMIENIKPEK